MCVCVCVWCARVSQDAGFAAMEPLAPESDVSLLVTHQQLYARAWVLFDPDVRLTPVDFVRYVILTVI